MANVVLAWNQRPEYLAYTDWTPIPGVTSYAVPRNGTGTDVTQFHPGQAFLSENNLPDIMYQLHPCAEWRRFKNSPLPKPKRNLDNSPVYEQWTRPGKDPQVLLDFKILPDKISTKEAWWYHEFVRRMDPRIRQRDIIMREEVCAERLRMTDQQYINIHLNTPGYRTFRPAWKMIAWHVTAGDAMQNQRKQSVLDQLTDAQKQANTTRGSSPGLINPALGEIYGNRIPLPDLAPRKRGRKRIAVNVNNVPATQTAHTTQVLQAPYTAQVPQVAQIHQAPQIQQATRKSQNQLTQHSSRVDTSNPAIAPSSMAPANISAPCQNVGSTLAAQKNNAQAYANAQARDAAAMPPPLLPLKHRKDQFPQPWVIGPHPETNQSPEIDGPVANSEEGENIWAAGAHVPEPEYPLMSDEEIAAMSTKSEEAMAEIHRICEPFLGPCSNPQVPPLMAVSPELINNLGVGFLFPSLVAGTIRRRDNEGTMLNPARTMGAPTVGQGRVPLHSEKQGKKRKECDDGTEDFQHIQLDVERQARRPEKRVKSVHRVSSQNKRGELYHDTAHNIQRHPHVAPQRNNYRHGSSHGQTLHGLALQGVQPAREPYISPYQPAPSTRDETLLYQNSTLQPRGSVERFSNGYNKAGQTLEHHSSIYIHPYNAQSASHQSTTRQPGSRVDRGHHGKPREEASSSHRFHPYANSRNGTAQSMEASQIQQLVDDYRPQPLETQAAQVGNPYIPDMLPALLEDNLPSTSAPGIALNQYSEGFFIYKNNDPRQGLDVKATRKVLDWFSQG